MPDANADAINSSLVDKGVHVLASQIYTGLIPQPNLDGYDGGIVYVVEGEAAACMQQAWSTATASQEACSSMLETASKDGKLQMSVAATLANATIAIAPPPLAYLFAPKPRAPSTADSGAKGRARGRGTGRGGGPGSRGGRVKHAAAAAAAAIPPGASPLTNTAEAAQLAAGIVPRLSKSSAALHQSLLTPLGEPLVHGTYSQAVPAQAVPQASQALAQAPQAMAQAPQAIAQAPHALAQAPQPMAQAPQAIAQAPHAMAHASQIHPYAGAYAQAEVHSDIPWAVASTCPPTAQASEEPGVVIAAASGSPHLPMAFATPAEVQPQEEDPADTPEQRSGVSKTSARALLAQHKVKIPDDLTKLQPIPTRRTKSGWVGVYPARKGRWQAQVNHRSIGGYSTAWEAGVAVAAHLVVMARAEEQAEAAKAECGSPVEGTAAPTEDDGTPASDTAAQRSGELGVSPSAPATVAVTAVAATEGVDGDSATPTVHVEAEAIGPAGGAPMAPSSTARSSHEGGASKSEKTPLSTQAAAGSSCIGDVQEDEASSSNSPTPEQLEEQTGTGGRRGKKRKTSR